MQQHYETQENVYSQTVNVTDKISLTLPDHMVAIKNTSLQLPVTIKNPFIGGQHIFRQFVKHLARLWGVTEIVPDRESSIVRPRWRLPAIMFIQ